LARGVIVIVLALTQNSFNKDDKNDDHNAAFISACRPCHRRQATAALVWGLVVALACSLAQALARGVFVIVLALAQNLFDDNDDNDDDDDAFVSPCRPPSEMVLCPILWGINLSHIYAREVR
jgi:hypothetical protein